MSILKAKTFEEKEARLAYLLIIPTFIIVVGLVIFPAVFSIWISFHNVTLANINDVFHAKFVGLSNFIKVFKDFAFSDAVKTTIFYSFVSTLFTIIVGLIASLILNRKFFGRGLVRAIFLFSYVAPIVSVAYIWKWLLNPTQSGVLNWALLKLNTISEPISWLGTRGITLLIVILFQGWRYFPFAMLMILARLQAIDKTLYEAADVDGANVLQKFWNITIPELRYVLGTLFLLRLMWTFNKFDDIFLLTSGGFGTKVLPILTYEFSFKTFNFGKGSATAMILFVILAIFMVFYMRKVLEW